MVEEIDEDIYKKALASGESEKSARNKATKDGEVKEMKDYEYLCTNIKEVVDVVKQYGEKYGNTDQIKAFCEFADKHEERLLNLFKENKYNIKDLKDVREFLNETSKFMQQEQSKSQTLPEKMKEIETIDTSLQEHKSIMGVPKRLPLEEELNIKIDDAIKLPQILKDGKEKIDKANGNPTKKKWWTTISVIAITLILIAIAVAFIFASVTANNQQIQNGYNQQIQSLHNDLQNLTQSINDKQSTVDAQNQQIQNLNAQINKITSEKQATTNAQNQEIQKLQHQIQDLTLSINEQQTQSGTPKALPNGVLVLKPNANGSSHGLTGDWKTVSDGDTSTYARSNVNEYLQATSTYAIPNPNHLDVGNIIAITVEVSWTQPKGSSYCSVQGAIGYYGIVFNVPLDTKITINPQTEQAWSWSDIDHMETGATVFPPSQTIWGYAGTRNVQVSEVALKVFYEVV